MWKRDVGGEKRTGLCRLLADWQTVREMTGSLTHLLRLLLSIILMFMFITVSERGHRGRDRW